MEGLGEYTDFAVSGRAMLIKGLELGREIMGYHTSRYNPSIMDRDINAYRLLDPMINPRSPSRGGLHGSSPLTEPQTSLS